jgi:addiction module RelE/StbE family toxin
MGYKLIITKAARDDLTKLDRAVLIVIQARIKRLAEQAESVKHFPLTGQFAKLYKLRVHDKYRVIYDLQHEKKRVVVVRVGKRDEIYED